MVIVLIVALFLAFSAFLLWITFGRIKDLELLIASKQPQDYVVYKSVENKKEVRKYDDSEDYLDPFEIDSEKALAGLYSNKP